MEARGKGEFGKLAKAIEVIEKQKASKIVGPKKGPERGDPTKFKEVKYDTKAHPGAIDKYEEAKEKLKRLKPTLKDLMPAKAMKKEELEKKRKQYEKKKNQITEKIKKEFQKRLDELSKDVPKLKGKEEFQIKEEIIELSRD